MYPSYSCLGQTFKTTPEDMRRLDAYRGQEQHIVPHYPEAYLESKHCKIFAHWRTPKGVSISSGLVPCISLW